MTYIDARGYLRDTYGKLVHREIAYQNMYKGNEYKFDDYFGKLKVHHIDGDKQNNKVSNLFICSYENHGRIHLEQKNKLKKFQTKRELLNFLKKPKKEKEHKKYKCEDCGREINHRGCCLPCNKERKAYREKKFSEMKYQNIMRRTKTGKKSYAIWIGGSVGFFIGLLFPLKWIVGFIIFGMLMGYLCKLVKEF